MGLIPQSTIEKIIQNNDIVDVISEFVSLKKSGRNYMGVCPFHNDKGPSLSVSPEKQLYHCFGCGASGNVVSFIMNIRRLEFLDAIKYLADRVSIVIEEEDNNPIKRQQMEFKKSLLAINKDAARFFFSNIKKSSKAIEYLNYRKIDSKTINKFGLGYSIDSWNSLYKYLKSKGYKEDVIKQSGLVIYKDNSIYDRFRNRIMFPVFDIKGNVIGFGGRVLDDSKPKYLNSPETMVFQKGSNLYGLNYVIKSGLPETIIISEGYMDCIALHTYGINNAVASLGTALTTEQAKLLKRYTKDIYICYDSDSAGQTATLRGIEVLSNAGCKVKIISIPLGKDPDEFLKNNGTDAFKNLINNAKPIVEYRINMAKSGKNLKDVEQRNDFAKEIVEILSKLDNEIEIQTYATKVQDELGIDIAAILDEIRKIKKHTQVNENNKLNIRDNNIASGNFYNIEPAYIKSEKEILKFIVKDEKYYAYISNKISKDELSTPIYRYIYEYLSNKLDNNEKFTPQEIISKFQDKKDIDNIAQIFYIDDLKDNNEELSYKTIDDFVRNIKKYSIENKINDLILKIKAHEVNNELIESAALSQELIKLQKQLGLL